MKITKIFLLFSALAIFTFFINYAIEDFRKKNEVINVSIILVNKCELADEAFMVNSIPENKIAKFENGITRLRLKRSSKVMLAANDKFEGFHYSGVPTSVTDRVELVADCNYSGRLDNIFESLRNQFKE